MTRMHTGDGINNPKLERAGLATQGYVEYPSTMLNTPLSGLPARYTFLPPAQNSYMEIAKFICGSLLLVNDLLRFGCLLPEFPQRLVDGVIVLEGVSLNRAARNGKGKSKVDRYRLMWFVATPSILEQVSREMVGVYSSRERTRLLVSGEHRVCLLCRG